MYKFCIKEKFSKIYFILKFFRKLVKLKFFEKVQGVFFSKIYINKIFEKYPKICSYSSLIVVKYFL